jgi:hypothetical protein
MARRRRKATRGELDALVDERGTRLLEEHGEKKLDAVGLYRSTVETSTHTMTRHPTAAGKQSWLNLIPGTSACFLALHPAWLT